MVVFIRPAQSKRMPLVPVQAVQENRHGKYVLVVGPDNKVEERPIKVSGGILRSTGLRPVPNHGRSSSVGSPCVTCAVFRLEDLGLERWGARRIQPTEGREEVLDCPPPRFQAPQAASAARS